MSGLSDRMAIINFRVLFTFALGSGAGSGNSNLLNHHPTWPF